MKIRQATIEDRVAWDAFVDSQGGNFRDYFDWKFVDEADGNSQIKLIVEQEPQGIIGIFQMVKKQRKPYSSLHSRNSTGIPLMKKDLSQKDKYLATKMCIQYLDDNFSKGCASSRIIEIFVSEIDNPSQAILDCGYRLRYDSVTKLPCNFVLELKPPFEKNIWMGLWSQKFRQALRKVEKNGVTVAVDQELAYTHLFVDMLYSNYRRHFNTPPTKEALFTELKLFKDKTKFFIAIKNNTPVYILCCHYTPSTCYLWQAGSFSKDVEDINKYTLKAAIEDACNSGYQFVDFGRTEDPGLASLKERYRGVRLPTRTYEKRYSTIGIIFELTPLFISNVLHKRNYLWKNRKIIWDLIFRW